MKKFLALLLVALLFLSSSSFAAEEDLIGVWYILFESRPQFDSWYLYVINFKSDHTACVYADHSDYLPATSTMSWSADPDGKTFYLNAAPGSIFTMSLVDGILYYRVEDGYRSFHRLDPFSASEVYGFSQIPETPKGE